MQQGTMTQVEFDKLSREQLAGMVAARGQALMSYIAADKMLRQKINAGKLAYEDMARMEKSKEAALLKLGETETAIIFGETTGSVAN